MESTLNSVQLYHLRINNIDSRSILEYLDTSIKSNSSGLVSIFFLNAHCFNLSLKDSSYYEALAQSDILLNDGMGIKIASAVQGVKIEENMNGTDFIPKVVNYCQLDGVKIFLLGGKPGVAAAAARNWVSEFPNLNICGTCSGYFTNNDQVIQQINDSGAQVLIVGMGVPKQEIWLHENRETLGTVKVAIAGGAILDFAAKIVPRAPKILRKIGLEWIYRLYREPRRLAKRYIVGNVVFLHHIIVKKIF